MSGKILKKITMREMGLDKITLRKEAEARTPKIKDGDKEVLSSKGSVFDIAQFIGSVSAVRPGESDNGPFCKLIGQFEAINMITGEAFSNSSVAILPNFIGDSVADAVKKLNGNGSVDFAVKITAQYNEASAVGYDFGAVSLMPTAEADAVLAIKAKLGQAGIALAAPKTMEALAAPAAEPVTAAAPEAAPAEAPKAAAKKK